MKNRKQLFKYLISLLIFGMNGIVANQIAMTSEQIVLSRTIIGGALLVILFFTTRQQLHKEAIRRQWPVLLLSGAAMGLSWIFLFGAYRLSSVSMATLLYYSGPVFVLLLAPVLFREKLTGSILWALSWCWRACSSSTAWERRFRASRSGLCMACCPRCCMR